MTNSFEDAAQILRKLKRRVDRNQEERTQSGPVNVFRGANDRTVSADKIGVTVDDAGSWTWGESKYDHDEWSG